MLNRKEKKLGTGTSRRAAIPVNALGIAASMVGGWNLFSVSVANAAIYTWDGGQSTGANGSRGDWDQPGNWGASVPISGGTNTDDIHFAATRSNSKDPDVNVAAWLLNSLTFDSGAISWNIIDLQLKFNGASSSITQNATNSQTVNNALLFNTATALNGDGSGIVTLGGVISGTSMTKTGLSEFSLTGTASNTLSGLTTVSNGTLDLGKTGTANAIGAGGLTVNSGGSVFYTGTSTDMMGAGAVTLNGTGTLNTAARSDTIGSVTIVGATSSTTNLTGTGTITVGTLSITPAAAILNKIDMGSTGKLVLGGSVTFTAATSGQAQIIGTSASGSLDLGGNRAFSVGLGTGAAYDLDISGVILGSTNTLTLSGGGRLQLSGAAANTYSGLTSVNAGTLLLNKSSGVAIAGNLTVGDGAGGIDADVVKLMGTNEIATGAAVTVASSGMIDLVNHTNTVASLTLTGGDIQSSTAGGNLTSTAAPTFSGTTNKISVGATVTSSGTSTLTSGALQVNGTLASGLTMSASTTLTGTGRVGATNANLGGTVSPGVNGTGTLTVAGNFTLGAGKLAIDMSKTAGAAHAPVAGADYDQLIVTSGNTVSVASGVLALSIGNRVNAGEIYYLVDNQGSNAITGTFANATINGSSLITAGTSIVGGNTYQSFTSGNFTFAISYTATAGSSLTGGNDIALDVVAAPEPTSLCLLGLGVGGLLARRKRKIAKS